MTAETHRFDYLGRPTAIELIRRQELKETVEHAAVREALAAKSLSQQVALLEENAAKLSELCGEVLATLALNSEHLTRGMEEKQVANWNRMVEQFRNRFAGLRIKEQPS